MSAMLDYMQLCRLCLVKEKVNVPIFGDENDVRQIFLKITACLPVKVSQEDNLPKKICDSCLYKVDLLYQFWNTTVNAEKQLIQWLTEIGVDVNIKNSDTQTLPILPQSHAHPHSMPDAVILKQERPDMADQQQAGFQMQEQQNIYPGYDNLGYPQPEVTMEVGAAATFVQPQPKSEPPSQEPAPTPKKRGRPAGTANKKSPPKKKPAPAPPVVSPRTNSTRRSSATAAAAAVAAAAAAASDSEEDSDGDRLGGMDDDDSDSDEDHITKEEMDSDEDYVEPTAFVGVPSSADGEQPGPSGLGTNAKGGTPGANATESGNTHYEDNKFTIKDPIDMEPIITIVELPVTTNWKSQRNSIKLEDDDDDDDGDDDWNDAADDGDNDSDAEYSIPKKYKTSKSNRRGKPQARRGRGSKSVISTNKNKYEGYKNPFVYDHLKVKEDPPTKEQKSKMKTKWTCLICNKVLNDKSCLINHYAAHKDDKIKITNGERLPENEVYQCEVCLKEFTSEKRFEKHAETHNDNKFNCEYCEKSFKRPYEYAVHMRFHSNDDKLKCHMCEYSTSYNSALKTHIKRHESEYKYRCEECGKGFFVYTWFEEHKNFHTGAKPFTCDICGKQFAYTRYLTAHKRSMHPETCGAGAPAVNECQFCQKRFAHKKSLLLHIRGHTGENTVLCDICGKRLSSNDHLKLHRRIHTGYKPYKCSVCGKGFSKKCNLTLHERVHSGEKPYVCDACGKCFSQRSTLVIHTRYHTGARPYVCHLCNKGFVAKGVLGIHLKSCNRQNIIGNYLIQPIIKR